MTSSSDVGFQPLNNEHKRGKWSAPQDFLYACIGHAFKVDAIFIMPSLIFNDLGIYVIIPYLLALGTCVVPIVFIQSYLGQFSSNGFITAFRIAPLFKGIGFVSLALNLTTLTYYSVFAAIPLFYFFHSLRPTLPWSCDGIVQWLEHKENITTPCKANQTVGEYTLMEVPSLEFFREHLDHMDIHKRVHPETRFSWAIMICAFFIWIAVGAILCTSVEMIGKFLRYSLLFVVGCMCLCIVRFAFLPGAIKGLTGWFEPEGLRLYDVWASVPLLALSALGPGWGTILSMASYNNFKTNIFKYSWVMCLAQFGIVVGMALMSTFIVNFLQRADPDQIYFHFLHTQWMEFLITPTALTFLEVPHLWSFIFFGMLILGSLNLLIVQLFSVVTSLFDEFQQLRPMKREFTLGLVVVLALISAFFCSNFGLTFSEMLNKFSILTQMVLNVFLLVVVLWVYGRERFQQDITFMTSRVYPTWTVNIVRFVAPLFLILSFFAGLVLATSLGYVTFMLVLAGISVIILPWCFIPGYCCYKYRQTNGMVKMLMGRSVDWHPADQFDKQRYEDTFGDPTSSHQMTSTTRTSA